MKTSKVSALLLLGLLAQNALAYAPVCRLRTYIAYDGALDVEVPKLEKYQDANGAWDCFQKAVQYSQENGMWVSGDSFYYADWAYMGYNTFDSGMVTPYTLKCKKFTWPEKNKMYSRAGFSAPQDFEGSQLVDKDCSSLDHF